jgi:hypothetical protein
LGGQIVDELIVAALRDVVEVLNADNFCDCPRLGQLSRGDTTLTPAISTVRM